MISDELIKAIEDSKFYIIVFSKNYASSSWCLAELVKIMECQTMNEHTAYPVFYDVEPTEVRKQTGAVGVAFARHKEEKAARKWREALKEASDLAGFELKSIANGHEAKFIQKIVEKISLELRFINSSIDGNLIGMQTRVNEVISSLEPGVGDVRMLGIWGMGGAGKTTLARAIFDQISIQFEGESFIENVREVSKASLAGLKDLQKQVLSDVLKDQNIEVSSVSGGKSMMQRRMHGRKVLVVLDDVDHKDQLEALAGDCNWFKPGSRIIFTTRDEQVLVAHRVSLIHNVTLLSQAEAACLFSRYAFGRENPIKGYEELSGKVLQYADGLPLTIKVMGSFLCGQSEPYWIDAIQRLKTIPLTATMDRLEISFDGLEREYKEMFLDVACILKGWKKEDAIRMLESRGFHAKIGLRVLEQKSLITYNEDEDFGLMLGMHDHLEEMGRNIVRRSHPDEPQRHSRLWIRKEIEDILTNDLGTQATKCLRFYSPDLSAEIVIKGLAKMKDLRYIHIDLFKEICNINIVHFDKVCEHLPSSLRYMRWNGFPYSSLPHTFQGKYLVGLELYGSNTVQLWEDGEGKVLHKLRFLTFNGSKLQIFDLRMAPNLEQLTIQLCYDLVELHIPSDHHSKLKYLTLRRLKLTNLHLGNTPNLKKLLLEGCNDLVELQMPAESLKLEYLGLYHSKLKSLHLGNTPNLKTLILEGCNDLVELQMPAESLKLEYLILTDSKLTNLHLGNTPNLEKLKLKGCNDLVELQMPAESLKLEYLSLCHSKLKSLRLGNTPNLEMLKLKGCNDLVEFHLPAESLKLEYLDLSSSKLKSLNLGVAPNLEMLSLEDCYYLVELHIPDDCLKLETLSLKCCHDLQELQMPVESLELTFLDLSHSKVRVLHLGITRDLEKLSFEDCHYLVELCLPAESLKLKSLNLSRSKLRTLYLGFTPNLETLSLADCHFLVELHLPAKSLMLKSLTLSHSKLMTLYLGVTPNLVTLSLKNNHDLVELHMPAESLKLQSLYLSHSKLRSLNLGTTPNLETLSLKYCHDLQELQMPAESLKLKSLDLGQLKLRVLHLENTTNLETLSVIDCHELVELHMPAECLKLKCLNLNHSKLRTFHLRITPVLETLRLQYCYDLVELQMPAESLNLIYFDLGHSKLTALHLGITPNLEMLSLRECHDLVELHMPTQCLKLISLDLIDLKLRTLDLGLTPNLETLRIASCDMVELHMSVSCLNLRLVNLSRSKLRTFNLGMIPNLERLCLKDCLYLVEISAPVGCLKKLVYLDINNCGRFERFLFDKRSQSVEVGSLSELHLIANPIDACPLHSDNSIPKFQISCYYKEDQASLFGNLERLILFGLCACTNLESLSGSICDLQHLRKFTLEGSIPEVPKELQLLNGLEELILVSTKIKHLPESICMQRRLKSLKLRSCWHLEKLPEDLGQLQCLEELDLTECIVLRDIPNSICQMKSLKYFHLPYCFLVEKLPEEIGSLKQLKELNIEATGISHLPQSIFQLKCLCIVGFTWQLQSYGFRSVIQTSTYVSFAYTSYHSSANHLEKPVFDVAWQLQSYVRRPLTGKQSARKGLQIKVQGGGTDDSSLKYKLYTVNQGIRRYHQRMIWENPCLDRV